MAFAGLLLQLVYGKCYAQAALAILALLRLIVAVPSLGMTGVAASMATGTVLLNVSAWIAARRLTGVWTHVQPASLWRRGA